VDVETDEKVGRVAPPWHFVKPAALMDSLDVKVVAFG